MKRSIENIGEILEGFYHRNDRRTTIPEDPIEFPHRYSSPEDIEIAGFIASSLAFGRVASSKPAIQKILSLAEGHPHQFVLEFNPRKDLERLRRLYYRIWSGEDLACLILMAQRVLRKYGSMGALFSKTYRTYSFDIQKALSMFINELFHADTALIYGRPVFPQSLMHLLPSPARGSACKRLNLFLRWMVRSGDGVDFGIWPEVSPAHLVIPLDAHIIRITRYLGFHRRRTPDWKMAAEITSYLKKLDPGDPVKYDFALCHLGISDRCPLRPDPLKCRGCDLNPICLRSRKLGRKTSREWALTA